MRIDRRFLRRVAVAIGAVGLLGFAAMPRQPWLIYNHTPSVPVGFYLRVDSADGRIQRGDLVAFSLPRAAHRYAQQRGEPTDVRLLKPVLAFAGDRVSTLHGELRINGALIGAIPDTDSAARSLPRWRQARTLKAGEMFVGSTHIKHSFDSRFFGPIHASQVIGVYRPLWVEASNQSQSPAPSASPTAASPHALRRQEAAALPN